jgi:hypothetical protein
MGSSVRPRSYGSKWNECEPSPGRRSGVVRTVEPGSYRTQQKRRLHFILRLTRRSVYPMNQNSDLALAKQAFDELIALCAPEKVADWNPLDEQRAAYIRLAEKAREGVQRLETAERRQLLTEGSSVSVLPEALLAFVREQIRPRDAALRAAIDHLDPEGKPLRELWAQLEEGWSPISHTLLSTFEEGLQQIYQLQDRNPELENVQDFAPDTAYEIVNSRLVRFEPDAWLSRVQDILPIRTEKKNFQLPMHIRFRLRSRNFTVLTSSNCGYLCWRFRAQFLNTQSKAI